MATIGNSKRDDWNVDFCNWKGWVEQRTLKCILCRKDTTGRIKDVRTQESAPLCDQCARVKGLA